MQGGVLTQVFFARMTRIIKRNSVSRRLLARMYQLMRGKYRVSMRSCAIGESWTPGANEGMSNGDWERLLMPSLIVEGSICKDSPFAAET